MNKQILIATIGVFLSLFLYGFVAWGTVLTDFMANNTSPTMWRPDAEQMGNMPWIIGGQLLLAYVFVRIFLVGYQGRGIAEGLRFGGWVGLLFAATYMMFYALHPVAISFMTVGALVDMGSYILAGGVAALITEKVGK